MSASLQPPSPRPVALDIRALPLPPPLEISVPAYPFIHCQHLSLRMTEGGWVGGWGWGWGWVGGCGWGGGGEEVSRKAPSASTFIVNCYRRAMG